MKILAGISNKSRVALIIAGAIMLAFFTVETCIVFGLCEPSYFLASFGYACIITFMPPFFYVVRDFLQVTAQKEENINVQLNAIDTANLVVKLDMSGNVLAANKNFCNSTGYLESELIGKHHSKLVPEAHRNGKDYAEFWKQLKSGKNVSGEFERIDKNGKSIWLFGNYTPIKNRDGIYDIVLKIATDITVQHEAEIKVQQKSTYLEHASKIIRHDMHSGINTYLPRGINSLKRRLKPEDIEALKIAAPLQLIEDGLAHARKVYSGVYEFTNLVKEHAQMEVKECNLADILTSYLKLTAYKSSVIIDKSIAKNFKINEALFCTAIDNLIRNGLKYNDSPTKWVKIYLERDKNGKEVLCIEDNGRGITREEFIELSKPYARKPGQGETGTGLGLNICIEILKEHRMTIYAEKQQIGTKIYITTND